jgi:hypothetical protein
MVVLVLHAEGAGCGKYSSRRRGKREGGRQNQKRPTWETKLATAKLGAVAARAMTPASTKSSTAAARTPVVQGLHPLADREQLRSLLWLL